MKYWYSVWLDADYGNTHLGDYEATDADEAYALAYDDHCDLHLDMKQVYVEPICTRCGDDPLVNTGEPCLSCGRGSFGLAY